MFHPARMRKSLFLDELLSTLVTEPIQDVDNSISEAVSNNIYIEFASPLNLFNTSINYSKCVSDVY